MLKIAGAPPVLAALSGCDRMCMKNPSYREEKLYIFQDDYQNTKRTGFEDLEVRFLVRK